MRYTSVCDIHAERVRLQNGTTDTEEADERHGVPRNCICRGDTVWPDDGANVASLGEGHCHWQL